MVGGQLKLKDGVSLDFENEPSLTVEVTATDGGGLSFSQSFTITVNDVNEAPVLAPGAAAAAEDGPTVDVDLSTLGDDVDGDDDGTTLIFTNYLNQVAATDIDFPVVSAGKAAA